MYAVNRKSVYKRVTTGFLCLSLYLKLDFCSSLFKFVSTAGRLEPIKSRSGGRRGWKNCCLSSLQKGNRKSVVIFASQWRQKYFKCTFLLKLWHKRVSICNCGDLKQCEEGRIQWVTWIFLVLCVLVWLIFKEHRLQNVTIMKQPCESFQLVLKVTQVWTCEYYLTVAPSRGCCRDIT